MDVKMPVKFHGSYQVVIRYGDVEKKEICQKLNFIRLAAGDEESGAPTHQITYYAFGCKRMVEGRIKENREEKVTFDAQGREYEFTPSSRVC
ncbi:MAG TPA: hypothetical protein PLM79_04355 [Syntrophobacteraceae bacterium]|nr:hypothetical protein [Syntrophobacteraceae bacterium]